MATAGRKKEEGRRKKEEGRRKKEEGRTEPLTRVSGDNVKQTKGDMPHRNKASHWHVRCSLQERI